MKGLNERLNTARMMGNNGQDFYEDTSAHTGVWYGFQPHKDGCIVASATITNIDGETDTTMNWVGTTLDLDSWISAGVLNGKAAYITSITLTSGACTIYKDTIEKVH